MFKYKRIQLSIFLAILFFVVLLLVVCQRTRWFDENVYHLVSSCRSSFTDFYFMSITKLANTSIILVVLLLFILFVRGRHSLFLAISSIDCLLLTTFFKYIIGRSRPEVFQLIEQGGYSFPSGHTMFSVCVYGYFLYLVLVHVHHKIWRSIFIVGLLFIIFSIGISRIYVGVHFASDVLAGYLLGTSYLLLLTVVEEKFYLKRG